MVTLTSISQEIDEEGFKRSEKFASDRGAEFDLITNANGLYSIHPLNGGKLNRVIEGYFTSYNAARKALIAYIEENDRNGYAIHPDKPVEKIRKSRTDPAFNPGVATPTDA